MVKTPKTRHSKSHREPVTIELEPGAVSRVEESETRSEGAGENAETVAATAGDEAVAAAAATARAEADQPAAKADDGYVSYDYSFDDDRAKASEPVREAAAASDTPTPVAPVQRGGVSNVVAGLAGGLVALLAAGGLQFAGVLGTPGGSTGGSEQMQAEIASLKTQLAEIGASDAGGDLGGRVDALNAAIEQVKADAAKATVGQGGSSEALAVLDQRIKAMESSVASLSQSGAASSELAALSDRIATVESAVKAADDAAAGDGGKLAALEQSVSSLNSKVEAQASQPKIALAIAASALKAAVERGGAFAAELETFAAISPDAPELATLRSHAEKGVATRADIVAETDEAADAMIAAAKPVNPDAGIVERLVSSAESLVKVRPIGQVEGTGVPETVARMEVAVSQGDFAKALAEYETLPEAAKAAGAGFAAKLKARQEVETLVDQIVAGAMKA